MESVPLPASTTAWWRRRRVVAALAVAAAMLLAAGLLGTLVPSQKPPLVDGQAAAESATTFSAMGVDDGPASGTGGPAAAIGALEQAGAGAEAGAAASAAVDSKYESMFPAAAAPSSSSLFGGAAFQKDQQRPPAVGGASRTGLLGLSTCVAKTGADVVSQSAG